MQLIVNPSKLKGKIKCNKSKSQLLRLLIIGAQLNDVLTIYNPTYSSDVNNLISALRVVGANIITTKKYIQVSGGNFNYNSEPLFCGNGGAVARFLIPFCILYFKECRLICSKRLIERISNDIILLCEQENLKYSIDEETILIKGSIQTETIKIDTSISSQFASGFAMIIPFLSGLLKKIYLHGNGSKSYFLYTLEILKLFNIKFVQEYDDLYMHKKKDIINPIKLGQVVDYSNLVYYLILTLKYDISITNYLVPSAQPDYKIFEYFNKIGLSYFLNKKHILLKYISSDDVVLNMKQNPDLVVPLVILSIYFNHDTTFSNIERLTYKESNRLAAITCLLDKIKQKYDYQNNNLKIYKTKERDLNNLVLDARSDHRLIMSYIVLSYLFDIKLTIINPHKLDKSAPDFISNFSKLGAKFQWIED